MIPGLIGLNCRENSDVFNTFNCHAHRRQHYSLAGENKYSFGIALGIGLVFIYWLMYSLFLSLGQVGKIPMVLAAWLANIIFGLTGVVVFQKAFR